MRRRRRVLPLSELSRVTVQLPTEGELFDWKEVFGNEHPVHIEVGAGKGAFLVECARSFPEHNFLGIEVTGDSARYAASRLERGGLSNARMLRADARRAFDLAIPAASLHSIHVYFPDPWWKKKHHKRRLMNEAFVASCVRALRPQGQLDFASDVEEIFCLGVESLSGNSALRYADPAHQPPVFQRPMTNFERKARNKGRQIFEARFSAE